MNYISEHLSRLILERDDREIVNYLLDNGLLDRALFETEFRKYIWRNNLRFFEEAEGKAGVCIKAGILSEHVWNKMKLRNKKYCNSVDAGTKYRNKTNQVTNNVSLSHDERRAIVWSLADGVLE